MIGKAIKSLLTPLGSVYPMVAGQTDGKPYMVYTIISDSPSDTKTGVSTLDQFRVQVSVFGKTYAGVETLAASVRTTLDRYSGTVATVVINSIQFLNEVDMFDDNAEVYHKAQDYKIRQKR